MKSTPRHPPPTEPAVVVHQAGPRRARPTLSLTLQRGAGVRELPASRAQIRRWILAALDGDAELTLRFVNRTEARALNLAYRGRGYAPDVLTFGYDAPPGAIADMSIPTVRADIVVCLPVLREQARTGGITLAARLAHLIVHGTLHALGHDHETPEQAVDMEARETSILKRFRIRDPYSSG